MFDSLLWIEGAEFRARAAARRLGLGRRYYAMKGELVRFGAKKGQPRSTSILRIPLSDDLNHERHLRQIEVRLTELMTFLSTERLRYGDGVSMEISVGMTVGGETYFTRSFCASPALMRVLVALGIHLTVSAYPCSDPEDKEKSRNQRARRTVALRGVTSG